MAHDIEKKWRSNDVLVLENVDFSSMLLCDRVLAGLAKAGFKKPSPIQLEAIPTGRFGKDLLVQAKSGTGKTLVFVIVALEMIHRRVFRPQVLILVPTREIATQICSVVRSVGSCFRKLTCESFIGGFPVADDVKKAQNCQIVVGTPGRVKQLIEMKALSTKSIRLAVFDEADEVLTLSRYDDIDFIFNSLPEDKQVIATSATYPSKLKKMIIKYLREPYLAQIDTKKLALLGIIHYIKIVESSSMPIKQYKFKLAALEPVLKNIKFTQCLVYCNGIHRVETLYRDIKKWGFSTTFISSNRDQAERLRAIDNLKRFKCKVLVSSNVTARGIDAENVDLVINFDASSYTETYLHRSGRAGRYGTKGATISLVDLFELKFIERVEREAQFKSYLLPDPAPTDLIQNPVLDKYAIDETATNLDDSDEVSKQQPISMNGDNCPSIVNSEHCDDQSNNVTVDITDGSVVDTGTVNGVTVDAQVKSTAVMKENLKNILNSQNNCGSYTVHKESDGNSCAQKVDKSDRQKNSKDSESNNYISAVENGNTSVVSCSENAGSPDTTKYNIKSSVIVNECYNKKNVESLTNGESYLEEKTVNPSIIFEESSSKCEISEHVQNIGKNVIHVSENSHKMNVIESSLLQANEKIIKESSKKDNSSCQSANSEVACAKDSENNSSSSCKNSCNIHDKEVFPSSVNEPGTEVFVQLGCPTNPLMNDLSKNEINMAVENYIQQYENKEQTVLEDNKDATAENSARKNISLNHIRDLNSSRSDYYYKVFKLFQEVKSSKQSERVNEASKNGEGSPVDRENSIQEPIPAEICSTNVISNELEIESSLRVPATPAQEPCENDSAVDILNFHQLPCHESTPHFEKSKPNVTNLLNIDASEPPERIMSFFDEVSDESVSETESYYEATQSDPSSCSSSDSESDSESCTDSSSSSQSISSSDDDDSCDQDSTETSSSESHSSVDSLSVHSIDYSCRKDMKSLEKYPHHKVPVQTSLKKQYRHFECTNERGKNLCKPRQNPSHSNHFINFHQHSLGANYSNGYQACYDGQHFHDRKCQKMYESENNSFQFLCNGQHSPACFIPSGHRCHSYHDSTPCKQRAVCDQWYRIFYNQWQHIQNCSYISYSNLPMS